MTEDLSSELLHLPRTRRLLARLEEDLLQRRSLLLLCPDTVDRDAIELDLMSRLERRSCWVYEVDLDELDPSAPIPSLAGALGVEASQPPRTSERLLLCAELPDVVFLRRLSALDERGRRAWLHEVVRWARAAQGTGSRCCLCVLSPSTLPMGDIPATNVRLSVRWWWGAPDPLELRLLCRLADASCEPESLWREHVLGALAGDDVELCRYLWSHVRGGLDRVMGALRRYADERRRWDTQGLQALGLHNGATHLHVPAPGPERLSDSLRSLWSRGILQWVGDGFQIHSAALAQLGRTEAVRQRLWAGQASLVLPLAARHHHAVCALLTEHFGPDWTVRWQAPRDEKELEAVGSTPYACGWGHIRCLLEDRPELARFSWMLSLVRICHRVRNELAHGRTVGYHDFEQVWSEGKRLGGAYSEYLPWQL